MIRTAIFLIFLLRASLDIVFAALPLAVGGANLTGGALLNVVVLAIAGILALSRSIPTIPMVLWLPFLSIATLSVLWSPFKAEAIRAAIVIFSNAAVFSIPFFLDVKSKRSLLNVCIYSSIVPAIYGILELVLFPPSDHRIKSTFLHPNVFAFYLVIIAGVILFLLSSSTASVRASHRKFAFGYFGSLIGLIVLTQARAAWAGATLLLVVFAATIDRRFLLAVTLLPALLFVPSVSDRLTDLGRGGGEFSGKLDAEGIDSYNWRKLMWESALKDAANTPMLGQGLASFGRNALGFFPLVSPDDYNSDKGIGAHNTYVQIYYELGIVGLSAYIFLFAGMIWQAF